jgi:hypothetical protein
MFSRARLSKSVPAFGLILAVISGSSVFGVAGCGGGGPSSSVDSGTEGAVTITMQPASQTIATGQTATFTVVAAGTAPLTYQC